MWLTILKIYNKMLTAIAMLMGWMTFMKQK